MTARFVAADDAVALIADGATVATDGFGMMGVPEAVLAAIERAFLRHARPRDLTLVHAAGQSNGTSGIEHLAHEGLVRRVVGSHWGMAPRMAELLAASRAEAICLPQGQLAQLYQATAAGRPGNLTDIGLGTFVDPRHGGGKVNAAARASAPDLVRLVEVDGQPHLLYLAQPIDVAVVRVTSIDEDGNGSCEDEAVWLDALALAQAARTSGGTVICQARRVVPAGSIPPRQVVLPGSLVDAVVVAEDAEREHRQTDAAAFDARYLAPRSTRIAEDADAEAHDEVVAEPAGVGRDLTSDVRRIGARAVRYLREGDALNVGTGIPGDVVAPAIARSPMVDRVTISVESGVHGGWPVGGHDFGVAAWPSAIVPHATQFDLYRGALDATFMGVGELDDAGNVNVGALGGRLIGCGGFIDITQTSPRVYFCLRLGGRHRKLVERVSQVAFDGSEAWRRGQEVRYITELGVFALDADGLCLIEIAPDPDARERLEALAPFPLRVREPLLPMPVEPPDPTTSAPSRVDGASPPDADARRNGAPVGPPMVPAVGTGTRTHR